MPRIRIVHGSGHNPGSTQGPNPPANQAPTNILLSNLTIAEQTDAAVVGNVTVVDPDLPHDSHTFSFGDSRFEIVAGALKLKTGNQVVFATEPSISLSITATDQGGLSVTVGFTIAVQPAAADTFMTTVTIGNTLGSTLTNQIVRLGIPFARGAIPAGKIPILKDAGLDLTLQQIDNERAHDDGSLSSCTAIINIDSLASGGKDLAVYSRAATQSHTAGISVANILAADSAAWEVRWDVLDVDGVSWYAKATDALQGSGSWSKTAAVLHGRYQSGPLCVCYVASIPLRKVSDDSNNGVKRAWFHIYAHLVGGSIITRTEAFVSNGYMDATADAGCWLIDTITLKQNGTTIWSRASQSPAATLTPSLTKQPITGSPGDPTGTNGYQTPFTLTASASAFASNFDCLSRFIVGNGGIAYVTGRTSATVISAVVPFTYDAIFSNSTGKTVGQAITLQPSQLSCVEFGVAYISAVGGADQTVAFYSSVDNSAVLMTVVGTDRTGTPKTVSGLRMPVAGATVTTIGFRTITSITVTAGTTNKLYCGWGGFQDLSAIASGQWKIMGTHIPNRDMLHQTCWNVNAPRTFVQYDSAYLIATKILPNFDIGNATNMTSAGIATELTTFDTVLTAYPQQASHAQSRPDSADYNPFWFGPNFNFHPFGFASLEGDTGGRPEIGLFNEWEVLHLFSMTQKSWKNCVDRAEAAYMAPAWTFDENTGQIWDPRTVGRDTMDIYTSNTTGHPALWPASGSIIRALSQFWRPQDSEHISFRAVMAYLLTGDLHWCHAEQALHIMYWSQIPHAFGTGIARDQVRPMPPGGSTTTRAAAWYLRGCFKTEHLLPDTPYDSGILLPKSLFTSLRQQVSGRLCDQALGVTSNRSGYWYDNVPGNTPNVGDAHFIFADGQPQQTDNWQQHFMMMVLGWAHDNKWLTATEEQFFDWNAQYCKLYSTDETATYALAWAATFDIRIVNGAGEFVSSVAEWHPKMIQIIPILDATAANNEAIMYMNPPGTMTPSATSGTITLTFSLATLYPDAVGTWVSGNSGAAQITAVTDSQHATAVVSIPFASTAAILANSWNLGYPQAGPVARASFNRYINDGFANGRDYNKQWYGAMGSCALLPAYKAALTARQATWRTWAANDQANYFTVPSMLRYAIAARP